MQQPGLGRLAVANEVGQSEVLVGEVRCGEGLARVRERASDVKYKATKPLERCFEVGNCRLVAGPFKKINYTTWINRPGMNAQMLEL